MKRKDQKKVEAQKRQVIYDSLTIYEKADLVQTRRGGSNKERTRLIKSITKTESVI